MEAQGKREVAEAVLIAGLCALITGVVNITLQCGCNAVERERKRRKKKRKSVKRDD